MKKTLLTMEDVWGNGVRAKIFSREERTTRILSGPLVAAFLFSEYKDRDRRWGFYEEDRRAVAVALAQDSFSLLLKTESVKAEGGRRRIF